MRASARYQERQTNEAALRSLREERKWRTFSRTFSRTWSGKGDGFSVRDEPGNGSDEPVRFFEVDDSAISPLASRSGVVVGGWFSLIVLFFCFFDLVEVGVFFCCC